MATTGHQHLEIRNLGRMAYAPAFEAQSRMHEQILSGRDTPGSSVGALLLVEHDPVITISRRASAGQNLLATPELLARHGVTLADTDRGGDITYHGPGQLVAYPILDLNRLGLGLHNYMRMLEECIIRTIARSGLAGERDPAATGVWVRSTHPPARGQLAKIAALGVRVRRWVTMHGLALNIAPDMSHFDLIVPCGLAGRPVTSMQRELGEHCPTLDRVRSALAEELESLVAGQLAAKRQSEQQRSALEDRPQPGQTEVR